MPAADVAAIVLFRLFALGALLVGHSMPAADVARAAWTVRDVVLEEEPLFAGDDGREQTAFLLLVWWYKEARFQTDVVGGGACGPLQVDPMHLGRLGTSCWEVRHDPRAGLRAGLALMRELRDRCGSVRAGLGAYATANICGGAPKLVSWRMHLAGVQ